MIEQAFEVATEFRFDVGQAMLNTKSLQGAVDGLSQSATSALGNLNYLAGGMVARLGFGSGGLLSILSRAVEVAEDFDQTSLGFANNIMSNFSVLSGTINTFNDRLETSKMILEGISKTASSVGLPTQQLADLSMKLSTPLANRGKLGRNYEGSTSMAKNLLLASHNTGINPMMASESLYRALSEKMPLHGALFARLANTQAFKSAHITTQGQLTNMKQDKKIDLLTKALESLANDADALAHRLNSIGAQFTILKNQILTVLRPIGEAVRTTIIKLFKMANQYLQENGKKFGETVGKLIGQVFSDPKALLVNIMQLRRLGSDFKKALRLTEFVATMRFLTFILSKIGIELNGGLLMTMFRAIADGLKYLIAVIPFGTILARTFSLLRMAVVSILPEFLFFLGIFQGVSRALAMAKIENALTIAKVFPQLTEIFLRIKTAVMQIILPFTLFVDGLARLLTPLFSWSFWIEATVPLLNLFAMMLEGLGTVVVHVFAGISGIVMELIGIVDNLIHLRNPLKGIKDNFKEGYDDFLHKNTARLGGEEMKATANYVTNVGKIEARFDMREQLEPDRIAFAVTEHLKNLAFNPKQGRGNSLRGSLAGAAFAGAKAI